MTDVQPTRQLRLLVVDDHEVVRQGLVALLGRRDYVAPDDVQYVLPQTIAHRLQPVAGAGRGRVEQVRAMVEAVALP